MKILNNLTSSIKEIFYLKDDKYLYTAIGVGIFIIFVLYKNIF